MCPQKTQQSAPCVPAAAAAKSLQSCLTLCDPIDGSPTSSPAPGILQARILEWVAVSFSSAWKWKVKVKSLSCVQLFATPLDCSLPGSSIHGSFQARVLEWWAIAFSEPALLVWLRHALITSIRWHVYLCQGQTQTLLLYLANFPFLASWLAEIETLCNSQITSTQRYTSPVQLIDC